MTMPLTYKGRLPGVMCETNRPKPPSDPLQLDVTGFVGFAERGPLNLPVAVEDISQYQRIFGGDLAVATEGGRPVYAHLPSAVQSFFDNGGRIAYVVRVADENTARANRFLMPGLVTWQDEQIQPIVLPSAWVGHWSDSMSVGTQLRSNPLRIRNVSEPFTQDADMLQIKLLLPGFDVISSGDLLRLHFEDGDDHTHLLLRVAEAEADTDFSATMNDIPVTVRGQAETALCLQFYTPADLTTPDDITILSAEGWQAIDFNGVDALEPYTIAVPAESSIEAGQLLRVQYGTGDEAQMVYFPVDEIDHARAEDNTIYQQLVTDGAFRIVDLSTISGQPIQVDLLSFDVMIREGQRTLEIWSERRFGGAQDNWQDILTRIPRERFSMTQDDFTGSLRLGYPDEQSISPAIPFGMLTLAAFTEALPDAETTSKDGLDTFAPETLFLDDSVKDYGWRSLPARANQRLYLTNPPQKFVKLHSLWAVSEVAIIAIPDAVHRGWEQPEEIEDEPEPEPEPPTDERDWSRFDECALEDETETEPEDDDHTLPDWLHLGTSDDDSQGGRLTHLPELIPVDNYEVAPLLTVQRSLVNFCAARADTVGILTLPQHFKVREVTDWQQKFTSTPAFYDGNPLSYVATYHGWLSLREQTSPELAPLRQVPPDGVITGMIAARERNRGAWIAPANVALRGVVATTPEFVDEDWKTLYNRQINIIRQQPGRFAMMSAYTLSPDHLLLQLSIRRLLIFLRKVCLQQGQRYVFESNNTRFRERVQGQFERLLRELVNRGALVAFQVETGNTVNTQNDYDNGRFIIAIKIAPTNPIEFITITLLRSGETLLQVQEA